MPALLIIGNSNEVRYTFAVRNFTKEKENTKGIGTKCLQLEEKSPQKGDRQSTL